jgi:hypothetical protein
MLGSPGTIRPDDSNWTGLCSSLGSDGRLAVHVNTTRDRAHPTRPRVGGLTWQENNYARPDHSLPLGLGRVQRGLLQRNPRASNLRWDQKSYPHCGREPHTRQCSSGDMNDPGKDGERFTRIAWFLEVVTSFVLVALVAGTLFSLVL